MGMFIRQKAEDCRQLAVGKRANRKGVYLLLNTKDIREASI